MIRAKLQRLDYLVYKLSAIGRLLNTMIPIEEPLPTNNDIRSNFLETKSFGPVHYLEVGEWGQPLILVIHGSGPKNSSKAYEFFLYEYVARISYL